MTRCRVVIPSSPPMPSLESIYITPPVGYGPSINQSRGRDSALTTPRRFQEGSRVPNTRPETPSMEPCSLFAYIHLVTQLRGSVARTPLNTPPTAIDPSACTIFCCYSCVGRDSIRSDLPSVLPVFFLPPKGHLIITVGGRLADGQRFFLKAHTSSFILP